MLSRGEVQEAASPTFNVFRRLSRPMGQGSSSSNTPSSVNAFQDVVTNMDQSSPLTSSKPTPFKRLKSQLGKRTRIYNEKGKAVERTTPQAPETNSPDPLLESIPQSNETTVVAEPQSAGSCDYDLDCSAKGGGAKKIEFREHNSSNPNPDDDDSTISPTTLARRIHSLLSSFPLHHTLTPSGSLFTPRTSDQCGTADTATVDSTLFSLLSSVPAMNGSISKGRESVWTALERLRYLPHPHPKQERLDHGENNPSISHDHEEPVDMSSVMICGPLQPTDDTEVEIARSEVVSIDHEETFHEPVPVEHSEQPKEQEVGTIHWPFGKGKGRAGAVPLAEKTLPPPPLQQKEMRVWYPSRTKVSFQAFWWGYRIYLPPPVMRVLSDKSLEAAKRAALLTAALTWLVSHLPSSMLPPQMKAVVEVIKQIVPIMSYAGGFIAWSWNTIQGFDKGQGVTLSATWILPIAVVPGTWFYTAPPISSPRDAE